MLHLICIPICYCKFLCICCSLLFDRLGDGLIIACCRGIKVLAGVEGLETERGLVPIVI